MSFHDCAIAFARPPATPALRDTDAPHQSRCRHLKSIQTVLPTLGWEYWICLLQTLGCALCWLNWSSPIAGCCNRASPTTPAYHPMHRTHRSWFFYRCFPYKPFEMLPTPRVFSPAGNSPPTHEPSLAHASPAAHSRAQGQHRHKVQYQKNAGF